MCIMVESARYRERFFRLHPCSNGGQRLKYMGVRVLKTAFQIIEAAENMMKSTSKIHVVIQPAMPLYMNFCKACLLSHSCSDNHLHFYGLVRQTSPPPLCFSFSLHSLLIFLSPFNLLLSYSLSFFHLIFRATANRELFQILFCLHYYLLFQLGNFNLLPFPA
jgi:hypothetical protein